MGFSRAPDLTADQIAEAERLRAMGDDLHKGKIGWRRIAAIMGISETALVRHFEPHTLRKRRDYQKEYARTEAVMRREVNSIVPLDLPESPPPQAVIEEWERVMSAGIGRDMTALLLGDPLPGRSALDRKRMRETA